MNSHYRVDEEGNTELHRAVIDQNTSKVHSILEQQNHLLHVPNILNGDQPAHIAARFGLLNVLKILVEYEVNLSLRNYNALTPLGEAKMSSRHEIITFLQSLFFKKQDGSLSRKCYHPHLRIFNIVQDEFMETQEKDKKHKQNQLFLRQMKGATCIQCIWRWRQAQKILFYKNRMNMSAITLQRFCQHKKWKIRHKKYQIQASSAILIQSIQRKRSAMHFYVEFLKDRLKGHQNKRNLALIGQRFYRGYLSRRVFRLRYFVSILPSPCYQQNFDFWRLEIKKADPPKRQFGLFLEYNLGGTPVTWKERRKLFRERFRDVCFYVHKITQKVQWNQPNDWKTQDEIKVSERQEMKKLGFTRKENEAAKGIQLWWSSIKQKIRIRFFAKAYNIALNAEKIYFENPNRIEAICNYALYLHVFEHDFQKARHLYHTINGYMNRRGIDNPFVLYSLAIFFAIKEEDDWDIINEYAYRARTSEDRQGSISNPKTSTSNSLFNLAQIGFFRHAAFRKNLSPQQKGTSWCNYGLCQMIVYRDWNSARDCFRRAIHASPHDETIIRIFKVLLFSKDYMNIDMSSLCIFEELQLLEID